MRTMAKYSQVCFIRTEDEIIFFKSIFYFKCSVVLNDDLPNDLLWISRRSGFGFVLDTIICYFICYRCMFSTGITHFQNKKQCTSKFHFIFLRAVFNLSSNWQFSTFHNSQFRIRNFFYKTLKWIGFTILK